MRGATADLRSPHPLGALLPGIYRSDTFVQGLCAGLDEVLAPVLATLDALPAYLDPGTAPADVLEWLGGWVGLVADEQTPLERRRALVGGAVELHRWRGTARGVREALGVALGLACEVHESGAVAWSLDPAAVPPGSEEPSLVVTVLAGDPAAVDLERVDALVAALKPAHVPHRVRVG